MEHFVQSQNQVKESMANRTKKSRDQAQKPAEVSPSENSSAELPKGDGVAGDLQVDGITDTAAPAESVVREKLAITLDEHGGLDLGSMREKTKAKLIAALRKSNKDLFPAEAKPPVTRMPDGIIAWAYRILGTAETALAATRMPAEIAEKVFPFSDDEIKALMEPTQKVVSKHVGALKFQEEIELFVVLSGVHFRKMADMRRLLAEHAENTRKAQAQAAGGSGA